MKITKNKKLVFWLIGFGTGIIFSGIIMLIYTFNSEEYKNGVINEEVVGVIEKQIESALSAKEKELLAKEEEKEKLIRQENEKEPQVISVFIQSGMHAQDICSLLARKGVVEDESDFLNYLMKSGKSKHLRNGEVEFEIGADYDTIINLLSLK